jgi:hypothetical protein
MKNGAKHDPMDQESNNNNESISSPHPTLDQQNCRKQPLKAFMLMRLVQLLS